MAALDRHFPVGVVLEMGANTTLPVARGSSSGAASAANNVTGLQETIRNQVTGIQAMGLKHVLLYNYGTYNHEQQQALLAALGAATQRGGPIYAGIQCTGKTTVSAASGPDAEFLTNGAVANTSAAANPVALAVINDVSEHDNLLFYVLSDDTDSVADPTKAAKNVTLTRSFQAQDRAGRPATAMWRNTGYSDLGADCRLLMSYEYPCGRNAGGTDTPEGDFHRATFGAITGTSNPDWVDVIRHRVASLPSGARHMWCLQAHYTNSGGATTILRQPSDRELRKQFWVAVGEGATGVYWFTYTDYTVGTPQPMIGARQSANSVVASLASRLTPKIRQALLRSTKSADLFTTSGGGTSGLPVNYTSAYVSTLTHADGTRYVVICNNDTSTASVTVSSATLTGYLVSMENGTRYKIGADAISLPALDGTILLYEPSRGRNGRRGVPAWDVNLTQSVETWWGEHWANPSSVNYVSSANLPLHTNVVNVPAGANLQAYVDASPDYTTFSLAAGASYAELNLLERSHLHFTSANPSNKAKIARVRIWGTEHAQQYNSDLPASDFGFVAKLYSSSDASLTAGGGNSIRNEAQRRFLRQPSEDLVFDQIAFDATTVDARFPVAQPIVYYRLFQIGDDNPQTDHWYEGAPVSMRCVKDLVVQRCTISGYKWGSDNGSQASPAAFAATGNVPAENNTGPVSHPGLIWGNAGNRNVVVRDNTFTFTSNALNTGSPSAVFFDGAQGMVVVGNTGSGKLNADFANFLINDDFTGDMRNPGVVTESDKREGRYVVIASNTVTPTNQPALVSFSGSKLLVKGNTVNYSTSTVPAVVELSSKACRLALTRGVIYESYDCVIDGNAITANALTAFVEFNVVNAYTPGLTYASPVRSKIGRATVKNNTAKRVDTVTNSTVTRWAVEDSASVTASAFIDVATTITGNTPATDVGGFGT